MVKHPTKTDLQVLEYIQLGNKLNHLQAIDLFRTTGLRDTIYRLRKAGYFIQSERVVYKTREGRTKNYINYYVVNPETA